MKSSGTRPETISSTTIYNLVRLVVSTSFGLFGSVGLFVVSVFSIGINDGQFFGMGLFFVFLALLASTLSVVASIRTLRSSPRHYVSANSLACGFSLIVSIAAFVACLYFSISGTENAKANFGAILLSIAYFATCLVFFGFELFFAVRNYLRDVVDFVKKKKV